MLPGSGILPQPPQKARWRFQDQAVSPATSHFFRPKPCNPSTGQIGKIHRLRQGVLTTRTGGDGDSKSPFYKKQTFPSPTQGGFNREQRLAPSAKALRRPVGVVPLRLQARGQARIEIGINDYRPPPPSGPGLSLEGDQLLADESPTARPVAAATQLPLFQTTQTFHPNFAPAESAGPSREKNLPRSSSARPSSTNCPPLQVPDRIRSGRPRACQSQEPRWDARNFAPRRQATCSRILFALVRVSTFPGRQGSSGARRHTQLGP